jgi:hypothetical protein
MNSFNQTNPMDNYHDIIKNFEELGNNIQKIKEKLSIILQQLLQNPQIKNLIINNISLIKQYFAIQIQLNTILKEKFNYIPYINKYYDYIINLNQNLLLKITTFVAILETEDNIKIQQFINSLTNVEMAGIYLTFGDRLKDITAHSLETIASHIRNFNTDEFIKETQHKLENIQNTLQTKITDLSTTIQNNMNDNITGITHGEDIQSIEIQKGGKKFKNIYHPELKKWVNIKSTKGIDALLKYAYYN